MWCRIFSLLWMMLFHVGSSVFEISTTFITVVVIVAQWRDMQCFKELFSAKIIVTIMMMMTMIVAPDCALSLWFSFGFIRNPLGLKCVTRVDSFRIFSAKYHIWKPLAPIMFAREHWWFCVTVFLRTDWLNVSLLLFQIWYLANWIFRSCFPSTQGAVTRFNPYGFLVLCIAYSW